MKIRNGFVSNSSSSSFIIRGVRVKQDKLRKILGIEEEICDDELHDEAYNHGKLRGLNVEPDSCYFESRGSEKDFDFILGKRIGWPDDGSIFEVSNSDAVKHDESLIKLLKEMGIENPELSLFFQYISNDNF